MCMMLVQLGGTNKNAIWQIYQNKQDVALDELFAQAYSLYHARSM